jgi:hypothetical protein
VRVRIHCWPAVETDAVIVDHGSDTAPGQSLCHLQRMAILNDRNVSRPNPRDRLRGLARAEHAIAEFVIRVRLTAECRAHARLESVEVPIGKLQVRVC